MSIGIFANHATPTTGPGKLVSNLLKGFDRIGKNYKINQVSSLNGCLQCCQPITSLPQNTLIGPNIMVTPDEIPFVWERYQNHVVPSDWVYELYRNYEQTKDCNIDVWPVGIDTDVFNDSGKNYVRDCFVYFKGRQESELRDLHNHLDSKKITYETLRYGEYKEEDLINLTKGSRYSILLTGTESQGIAYMEILSSGVPCYVIDKSSWDSPTTGNTHPASSVPYFDNLCGVTSTGYEYLEYFLDNLDIFYPRAYIEKNHTLEISAKEYIKILEKSHAM